MDRTWVIKVGNETVDVQDIPARVVATIAKTNDRSWFDVVATPLADLGVAIDLVAAACDLAGVPFNEQLAAKDLLTMFEIEERED